MGEHFDSLTQEQQAAVAHRAEQMIERQMHGEDKGGAAFARNNTEQLRENLHEDLAQHGNLDKLVADYRETINDKYNIKNRITLDDINNILTKNDPGGRTR